jgi:DNA-binding transcriptional ArsR family regulator
MADLLPSSPDPSAGDGGDPRVIGVDSDDADDLLDALQSETARDLLGVLYDEPATPSGLAEEVDTSIQNVRYHLDKLADADLVEVADTIYSEKGREMKVYAPAAKPLVVFAGNDEETPGIEAALSRLLGGLGVLGLSSLAVQRIFGGPNAVSTPSVEFQSGEHSGAATTTSQDAETDGYTLRSDEEDADVATAGDDSGNVTDGGGGGGGTTEEATDTTRDSASTTQDAGGTTQDAATTTQDAAETTRDAADTTEATRTAEEATQTTQAAGDAETTVEEAAQTTEPVQETTRTLAETTTEAVTQSTTTVADAAGSATSGLPPGLLFFAGGLVVLLALGLAWYLRGR